MKHGIPFKFRMIDLPSRDHAAAWIIEQQLGRGNISDDQFAVVRHRALEANANAEAA